MLTFSVCNLNHKSSIIRSPFDPDAEVTKQLPAVHSDSISVESLLSDDEILLVFSHMAYTQESNERVTGK